VWCGGGEGGGFECVEGVEGKKGGRKKWRKE
jgi:hypothetical protein